MRCGWHSWKLRVVCFNAWCNRMIFWISGRCVLRNWMNLSVEVMWIYCTSLLLLPLATILIELLFNWVFVVVRLQLSSRRWTARPTHIFKVFFITGVFIFYHTWVCFVYEIGIGSNVWVVLSLTMETVWDYDFLWSKSLMAFLAIIFEVIVLLVVMSVRNHKGSMSSLLVLVEGFCWSWLASCLHAFHSTIPSIWLLWGLMVRSALCHCAFFTSALGCFRY